MNAILFGWESDHQLSTHATGGKIGGHPKWLQLRTGVETVMLHPFLCFWHHFCLLMYCFICRNLITLPLFKKDVFVRNGYFSPTSRHEIVFFHLNNFCEPKLAKTLLILIKQNLRYTLYFNMTPYFEKGLCSVVQEKVYFIFFYFI